MLKSLPITHQEVRSKEFLGRADRRPGHWAGYAALAVVGTVFLWQQNSSFQNRLSEIERGLDGRFNRLDSSLSALAPQECPTGSEEELIYYKILSMKRTMGKRMAREIASSVIKYSRVYGKEPDLILSVIAAESDFNPKAVSPTGAQGLMQVMPFWKKELGIPCDLKSVDCNIRYGVHILKAYRSRYEDLEYTLAAYNRGPLAVLRDVESGSPVGDQYTKRVLAFKTKLERME